MATVGPNAQFLNDFFGAKAAQAPVSSLIQIPDQTADRMKIAREYLAKKFHEVEKAVAEKTIQFSADNKAQANNAMNLVREGKLDIYGYIGMLFNFAAAPFKNLFNDFPTHLGTIDQSIKFAASGIAKPFITTPLPRILEAGVDSASHIWEAILKSIIIKRQSKLKSDEFNDAISKTENMLLDITQIPLIVLVELEEYLFNRNLEYRKYTINDVARERLSSDIKSGAIDYNVKSHETNLNFDFLKTDPGFIARRDKLKLSFSEEDFNVYGCPGLQVIPLFIKYIQQVFDQYLFPNFDELIKYSKPQQST